MPSEQQSGATCWFLEPNLITLPFGGGIRLDLAHWVEVGVAFCLLYLLYMFNTSKAGKHFNNNWTNIGIVHALTHFSPSGGGDDDEGKKGGKKSCDAGKTNGSGGGPSTIVVLAIMFLLGGMFCFHPPKGAAQDDGFLEGAGGGTREQRRAHEDALQAEIEAERNSPEAKERARREEEKAQAEADAQDAANEAARNAAKEAGGSTECQVCTHVLDGTMALISKPENRKKGPKIAKALSRYCKSPKTSKEKKVCYFLTTIKKNVAMPLSVGKDALFTCKKLSKENSEICQVKF
jgi:hypothetical protein